MRKNKGFLIAFLAVALALAWLLSPVLSALRRMHQVEKRVDHVALLSACQTMMHARESYRTTLGGSQVQANVDLADPSIPAIIRSLKPSYVLVQEDVVTVEMGGGFGHYGVVAFARGDDTTNRIPGHGRKKRRLIEGLWYYSD